MKSPIPTILFSAAGLLSIAHGATVSLDATTTTADLGNTATGSVAGFTVANNSNRLLVVTVAGEIDRSVDAVTFGSQSLTRIVTAVPASGPSTASLWYLLNPDAATATVSVTLGSSGTLNGWMIGVASFYNVAQQAPLDFQTNASSGGSTRQATVDYVFTGDAVIVESYERNNNGSVGTPPSGQTAFQSASGNNSGGWRVGSAYEFANGSQTNLYDAATQDRYAFAGAVFAAVPEPSSAMLGALASLFLLRRKR